MTDADGNAEGNGGIAVHGHEDGACNEDGRGPSGEESGRQFLGVLGALHGSNLGDVSLIIGFCWQRSVLADAMCAYGRWLRPPKPPSMQPPWKRHARIR